jgi:peptide subunit release factor 1 (eRF1)
MRALLRRLAEREPVDAPVLSIYLDMRPEGDRPALRASQLMLMDRLREIEKTLLPRGAALDSFRADVARIERYLDHEFPVSAQGVAIFACAAHGLFDVAEAGVPFEHQVSTGRTPDLFQLARLLNDQETMVVGVANVHTVRLFVMRTGSLTEVGGTERDSVHYRRTSLGALNQARYQRHFDNHRADFAREATAEIERLVEREGPTRVILAGNEIALRTLVEALSPHVAELVHGRIVRVDVRAPRNAVAREIEPLLARAEADDEAAIADQVVAAVRADTLGVAGLEHTRSALEQGQVDLLVLTPEAEIDDETRNDLIRLATTTAADVEVVGEHVALQRLGGVGALLRYRHPAPMAGGV